MSRIFDFTEVQIRDAILRKAPLDDINKNSKHWKGYLYINERLVGKVKIPNAHDRIMHASKSQYIAADLKLTDEQFNDFVECSLKKAEYFEILKKLP
jgi:hypothetical protein